MTNKTVNISVALDLDGDGAVDEGYEPILNSTDSSSIVNNTVNMTLSSGNATLATFNASTTQVNFTDRMPLAYPETISAHVTKTFNTGNISINITYLNQTGAERNGSVSINGTNQGGECNWTLVTVEAGDLVTDIINITWNASETNRATSGEIDIIATTRLNVTKDGYAKAIIYVNTSDNFNVSDSLQVRLDNYTATGISSNKPLSDAGVPITSDIWKGTGNLTTANGANDTSQYNTATGAGMILAGENNSIVVWQLNLTASEHENLTINNITVTENGTANGTADIDSIYLVNDINADSCWNVTEDGGIIANI